MVTSKDERLKYVLQLANGCCNHFAKMDKALKEIFFEALTFYNFFFEIEGKLPDEQQVLDDLYSVVKLLASANNSSIKWNFIHEQWGYIQKQAHKLAHLRVPQSE